MIVYRVCKKEEVQKIFEDESFTDTGYSFSCSDLNTHKYNKNSKYLHFFLDKDSIFYLRTLRDRYFCVYDIPEDILKKCERVGYYWDYINYRNLDEVTEYAIESADISFSFLKQVCYIKKDIDFDDFLDDDMSDFVDTIYDGAEGKKFSLNML